MADYYCQVLGVFPSGRKWSTARKITSSQSASALLTTWTNAWTAAWNDSTNGLHFVYPTGTVIQSFVVRTLGATMKETAVIAGPAALAGTNTNGSLPANNAIICRWSSSSAIGKNKRGHQKLPAPAENEVVNDYLVPATRTLITAAMRIMQTAIQADGSTFFVNPSHDTAGGVPAYTKSVMDTVTTRDKVGSAKKRLKKEPSTYA